MDKIRGRIILTLLCVYPFYSFITVKQFSIDPNYFSGILIYLLGIEILITRYSQNKSIVLPKYLMALGAFFLYTFLSSIFISDLIYDVGLSKYLYRDHYLRAIVILFVIENTVFEIRSIA